MLDLTSNGITHKGLSLIANALAARDSTRTDTQQVSSLKGNCPSWPTLPNKLMAPAFCSQMKSKNIANGLKQRANYTNESRLHTYHTDLRQISCRFVHVASTHIVQSLFLWDCVFLIHKLESKYLQQTLFIYLEIFLFIYLFRNTVKFRK